MQFTWRLQRYELWVQQEALSWQQTSYKESWKSFKETECWDREGKWVTNRNPAQKQLASAGLWHWLFSSSAGGQGCFILKLSPLTPSRPSCSIMYQTLEFYSCFLLLSFLFLFHEPIIICDYYLWVCGCVHACVRTCVRTCRWWESQEQAQSFPGGTGRKNAYVPLGQGPQGT